MKKNCENCAYNDNSSRLLTCVGCTASTTNPVPSNWEAGANYVPDIKTNADRIRGMRDEELAELFYGICSERDHIFLERMRDAGFENAVMLIETPIESMMTHLNWLRQPCKED